MGVASIVFGIIGLFFALIGLIPLLGIVNWIAIPLLVLGLIFGIIGICGKKKKRRGYCENNYLRFIPSDRSCTACRRIKNDG